MICLIDGMSILKKCKSIFSLFELGAAKTVHFSTQFIQLYIQRKTEMMKNFDSHVMFAWPT